MLQSNITALITAAYIFSVGTPLKRRCHDDRFANRYAYRSPCVNGQIHCLQTCRQTDCKNQTGLIEIDSCNPTANTRRNIILRKLHGPSQPNRRENRTRNSHSRSFKNMHFRIT